MQKATLLMLLLPLKWQVTDPAFTWALHINKAVQETNMPPPSTCLTSLQGFIKWLFSLQFEIVPTQLFLSKIGGQTWETVFILSAVYCCKDEMEQQSNIRNHWLLLHHTVFILWCLQCAAWSFIAVINWPVLIYLTFSGRGLYFIYRWSNWENWPIITPNILKCS